MDGEGGRRGEAHPMCKETKERQQEGEWKVKVGGLGKYRKVRNGATEERMRRE